MTRERPQYETDPMTVMCELMETEEFKETVFDPDEVSLHDLMEAVNEAGVSEKLGEDFMTEFHIGYKYMFYLGIPADAYLHQLGIDGYQERELGEQMANVQRQADE